MEEVEIWMCKLGEALNTNNDNLDGVALYLGRTAKARGDGADPGEWH